MFSLCLLIINKLDPTFLYRTLLVCHALEELRSSGCFIATLVLLPGLYLTSRHGGTQAALGTGQEETGGCPRVLVLLQSVAPSCPVPQCCSHRCVHSSLL